MAAGASAKPPGGPAQPDFGANVLIFDPSMPTSQIQAAVDAVANQQVPNQFGSQRYALLFKPGTYGTAANPLNFQVGYYTAVAGLGLSPGDVVINGSVYTRNQCVGGSCTALNNFWRSLSNLTINVNTPGFGCYTGEFWPVSQAAPMRRVHVNGQTTLMDYCTGPSFASGGFIADSAFDGARHQRLAAAVGREEQRAQRLVERRLEPGVLGRRRRAGAVLPGVPNVLRPVHHAPDEPGDARGAVPLRRLERELQRLRARRRSATPPARRGAAARPPARRSRSTTSSSPSPGDSEQTINNALAKGQNLIFTPGVYQLDKAIKVKRADTVVLGLGYPTLVPTDGDAAMTVADVKGVKLAGLMFDAGPKSSPVLLEVGKKNAHKSDPADPTTLSDVFFRIGGATPGKADDEPRREQRRRHPRRHLGLAGRPRQRRGLDGQHRRHRRDRQRRRRHRLRPVRRALPEATR